MFDPTNAAMAKPNFNKNDRIAIIGSGISGLSAAYFLSKDYEVTVFEESSLGGHAHSLKLEDTEGKHFEIDMGFIVFNEPCYPNFVQFLKHLDVAHELSDMSFGISLDEGRMEYSSLNMFAQKSNILKPSFISMLLDIVRFYNKAPRHALSGDYDHLSLTDYLKSQNYGRSFIEDHILPQAAAIWSSSVGDIGAYPFKAFMRFFANHGLLELDLKARIPWRTVTGSSHSYVRKIETALKNHIHRGLGASQVERGNSIIKIIDTKGMSHSFDHVVLACHADQALGLLQTPSLDEAQILSRFHYTNNEVIFHTDADFMPKRKAAWSSWNTILRRDQLNRNDALCVTYWMNKLQNIDSKTEFFVTLNPVKPIDPAKIIAKRSFKHPLFNAAALKAQDEIGLIQGYQNTWFAGAYLGSGFHEDGLEAGLNVYEAISGKERPWAFDRLKSRLSWDGMSHYQSLQSTKTLQ
jgi:predicted NAD/FAD-binding protein